MRPFNKTTATLVRPRPFSTLCPTPLGKSPVCVGLSILTGSVVNVSVNISHHEQVLYTQEEKNVSPDTDAVLPIYFNNQ